MSDNLLKARDAEDTYRRDLLRDFYMRRAAAILSSGDVTRIRLLREWQARERRQAA